MKLNERLGEVGSTSVPTELGYQNLAALLVTTTVHGV